METFTSIIKKIVFVLIILVFSCSGYFFIFLKGDKQKLPSFLPFVDVATTTASTSSEKEISELQETLSDLEKIKINSSFFTSPAFESLEDLVKTPLPELTQGRDNPFAPIGEETKTKEFLPKTISVPVNNETDEDIIPSV